MSKIYFKIFLWFWLVMIVAVVTSSLASHWYQLGADKHLASNQEDPFEGYGGRILKEIVSDAVNYSLGDVRLGMEHMPSWTTQHIFFITDEGVDVLNRPLTDKQQQFLANITPDQPFFRKRHQNMTMYGRQFQLVDGNNVTLIASLPNDRFFAWKLFFHNVWTFLLTSILISGIACYFIARYIMRDFGILKDATVRLAEGDWNARVTEDLCSGHTEFSNLATHFNYMADNLQKSMLEQKRLIKDVSHELRSPLARLQVALAIAQQKANDEITDELNRIKEAADYLNDVISNILSLPVMDQQGWALEDIVELSAMLSVVADQNSEEAKEKQVEIHFDNRVGEALIMSRGNTLVSVFDNILRNAIRYTRENSDINIQLARKNRDFFAISVTDHGPGVDEKDLKGIFEPFFRTCEARDRESGGYGLGLAIAQRTVLLHKGKIEAFNNHCGKGLTVEILLPVCDID